MALIKMLILLSGIIVLSSCDTFHGPKIRNELGAGVNYVAKYSSGDELGGPLGYCVSTFIGRPEVKILSLEIYNDKKLLFKLNENEVFLMRAREAKESGYSAWVLTEKGLNFTTVQPSSCK